MDKSDLEFQSEVNDIIVKVESRSDSDLSPGLMSDEEECKEQPYHPEVRIDTGEKKRFKSASSFFKVSWTTLPNVFQA